MNLTALKTQFLNGEISKYNFMDEMSKIHNYLFDYCQLIKDSCASKIEITENDVIVELETGIKLLCIKNDKGIIPLTILNFGEYEEKLWNKTAELIGKPRTVLDIGGNIGYFSLYFARKFPQTQFYCFEPIPNNYKYLCKNLELNHSQNIKAFNIGLSNVCQTMEMFYNPEGCGSSSLRDLLEASCTYKVPCEFTTLDNFVAENHIENIDFIKCDVEGAEKFVYEGGLKTLEKFKPTIYSEMLRKWSAKFNYHPNDIINLLKPLGYKCYAISKNSFAPIEQVTEETVETNFIFKQV